MTKANISMQKEGNSMMHFSLLGSQLLEISDSSALYIQTTWNGRTTAARAAAKTLTPLKLTFLESKLCYDSRYFELLLNQ